MYIIPKEYKHAQIYHIIPKQSLHICYRFYPMLLPMYQSANNTARSQFTQEVRGREKSAYKHLKANRVSPP